MNFSRSIARTHRRSCAANEGLNVSSTTLYGTASTACGFFALFLNVSQGRVSDGTDAGIECVVVQLRHINRTITPTPLLNVWAHL